MVMIESQELLLEYAVSGSEEAFRELVSRYIDLVYSTALRLVQGDADLAQDVTQNVFVYLCQNARKLPRKVMLGGWLHRHTCFVANKLMRGERRRLAREEQVALMEALPDHTAANLATVAPVLDEAINLLGDEDRTAILLRFFEQRDFRSVGKTLGSTEDAARMRVSRALEKLRELLSRRGVALSTAALATGLAGEAVTAAPAGLAASVAGAALAGSTATSGGATTVIKLITTMTKLKAGIIGTVLICGAAIPMWVQHQAQLKVREDNRVLRQQLEQLAADNERLSNQVAQASATPAAGGEQERELLKLRGEVGNLRRQVTEAAKAQDKKAAKSPQPAEPAITPETYQQQAAIARMNYAKGWLLAFTLYAQQHQDQFPTKFEEAEPFLPAEFKTEHNLGPNDFPPGTPKYGLTPDRFEILYQGSTASVTSPQNVIVVREKEAWQATDGGWLRAYGFADGHTEIHRTADGNFLPWEAQHIAAPPAAGGAQPGQ